MERRPKRQSSSNVDYRIKIRPVREPKLTIVHQQRASSSSDTNDDNDSSSMGNDIVGSVKEICLQLLDAINHLQDPEDGTYLNYLFLELPSKKMYPDYYNVIKHPISLQMITAKANKNEYTSLDDLKSDLQLMIANAKHYNMEESQVYQDALRIQKLIKSWTSGNKKRRTSRSSSTKATPSKNVLKLPGSSLTSKKNTNNDTVVSDKPIHTIRLKTSVSKSGDIEQLMTAIEQLDSKGALKILSMNPHLNVNQLAKVNLFNDTFTWGPLHAACYYGLTDVCESLIACGADVELNDTWYSATPLGWAAYGDHDHLARLLLTKYNANKDARNIHDQVPYDLVPEQDDPKWNGVFYMDPSVTRTVVLPKAAPTATNLQPAQHYDPNKKRRGRPPKSEIESKRAAHRPIHDLDLATFDTSSFLVDIFNSIRKNTDNTHRIYSELFEELPSREKYPDYYKLIKNPISLAMIEDKMRANSYKTIQEWFDDFVRVFENAMEYNENGSRIYKDGKLLLRMLYRMKDRLIFDYGVPETQEPELMALDLTNRPFELSSLKSKRYPPHPPEHTNQRSHSARPPPAMNHTPIQQHQPQLQQLQSPYHQYHQPQPQLSQLQHPQSLPPHNQFLRDQRQSYTGLSALPFQMMPSQMPPFTNPGMQSSQTAMMSHAAFNPQQQQQQQQYSQGFMPMTTPGMMMMNGTNLTINQPIAAPQPRPLSHIPQIPLQTPLVPSPPPQPPQPSPLAQAQVRTPSPASAATIPNGTPPHQAYFNLMAAQQLNHPPAIITKSVQEQLPSHSMPAQINAEFMDLINQDSSKVRLLDSLTLASDDKSFMVDLDGKQVGHSLVIPSPVTTIQLIPKLPKSLNTEQARVTIQVIHNTNNLTPQQQQQQQHQTPHSWSTGLSHGMNVFKLIIMVNATTPTSPQPDYRTQTYHIFANHAY
ncbi:unnamed protein product [Absidia cylindrospora]